MNFAIKKIIDITAAVTKIDSITITNYILILFYTQTIYSKTSISSINKSGNNSIFGSSII